MVNKFLFHSAAYLVAKRDGKVLLSRRYQTGWMVGMYSLPAGHIEIGETPEIAMAREAKEEIGIDVVPSDLKVVHVMLRNASDREYFDIFLEASRWNGEVVNNEPEKCDDLSWFSPDALPENILPYVCLVLTDQSGVLKFSSVNF